MPVVICGEKISQPCRNRFVVDLDSINPGCEPGTRYSTIENCIGVFSVADPTIRYGGQPHLYAPTWVVGQVSVAVVYEKFEMAI